MKVDNADVIPTAHPVLLGRFYPKYDIPVIIAWVFIILTGSSNWMASWCVLRTKALRKPFNMIVMALSFSNGVLTTVTGPMELWRILSFYPAVSIEWCNIRILLKTTCFSISMQTMFALSVMRLRAGLLKRQAKITYNQVIVIIGLIYVIAIASAPLLLNKTSSTFRVCFGNYREDSLLKILTNEGLIGVASDVSSQRSMDLANMTNMSSAHSEDWMMSFNVASSTVGHSMEALENNIESEKIALVTTESTHAGTSDDTNNLWRFYFVFTVTLVVGTLACYLCLLVILKRHANMMSYMMLGTPSDILTMRITLYVTCTFFVSFLLPFFPGIVRVPVQESSQALHYVSIYHCMSSLDGALAPLIYYFSNRPFRKALIKILPAWVRKLPHCFCCCRPIHVAPVDSFTVSSTFQQSPNQGATVSQSPTGVSMSLQPREAIITAVGGSTFHVHEGKTENSHRAARY